MQATWEIYKSAINGMHKVMLGNNVSLFDFTYVDNIAFAHILADEKLDSCPETVNGEVKS